MSTPNTPTVACNRLLAGSVTLEVFGLEAGMLRDSRQHARADLFTIVECEDNIGPAFPGERTVGARLPLELPANSEESCRHLVCPGAGPPAHAALKEMSRSSGPASPCSRLHERVAQHQGKPGAGS